MTDAWVSGLARETLVSGGAPGNARVSQVVVEPLVTGAPNARISQIVAEPLVTGTPNARVSQVVSEVLDRGRARARASQVVVEVLIVNLEQPMLPIYPDQSLLPGLAFHVKWSPQFYNMDTERATSGAAIDLGLADEPLHEFELNYDFLRDGSLMNKGSSEFKTMMGFFLRLSGTVGRFLFRHPDDNHVDNQSIGTTDGSASQFGPITRTFGIGDNSGTEAVGVIDLTLPVKVYLDGVLQDHATYSILTDTPKQQYLKFNNTPSADQKITMDFSYFYYCRFPDNTYTFEKFLDRVWLLSKINIESCRAGA